MSKVCLLLAAATLAAACGGESARPEARGTAGLEEGGGSGAGGASAGGGEGPITGAPCPTREPEVGSACDSAAIGCSYDVCDDDTPKVFSCGAGAWRVARACGPLECPPVKPAFLSDCAPLEGLDCTYVEDCCGGEPATQTVVLRCEFSRWTVLGPPDQACSFCQIHHDDGSACELPAECRATCYRTSCYAQPLVEECAEGIWRSQTLCSK